MDFEFSEEQRLLKDSVERLLKDRYDFEQRKAYARSDEGWSSTLWAQYAELGLLGLAFDEAHGGTGGGPGTGGRGGSGGRFPGTGGGVGTGGSVGGASCTSSTRSTAFSMTALAALTSPPTCRK